MLESALRSSAIIAEWAFAKAIPASSQTLDAWEPVFSFPVARVLCLFGQGVSSSKEVVGEAVLVALGPEVAEVIGVLLSTTHTTFFPKQEKGSFLLAFIWAYISWLNLVVISA